MKTGTGHIDQQAFRIAYLIQGYLRNTLTVPEHDELDAWVEASDQNMQLFEDLTDEQQVAANRNWINEYSQQSLAEAVARRLHLRTKRRQIPLWTYIAAASLLLAFVGLWVIRFRNAPAPPVNAAIPSTIHPAAGSNNALLILNDQERFDLGKIPAGLIKNENGFRISKQLEGQVFYEGESSASSKPVYHTLLVARGSEYVLILPDQSKVWLNAGSSLRFPTSFGAQDRTVELEGEAFFEITKDAQRPFLVKMPDGSSTKVLGTHFNVSAYRGQASKRVTLVEGSVEVNNGKKSLRLLPSQQAVVDSNRLELNTSANLDQVLAWKEGMFLFDNTDIRAAMQEIESWYDVDIVFRTDSQEKFHATISRKEPLAKVLHYLELTGRIRFKLEGRRLTVLSQ